ncbi:hypothetical protein OWV82_020177 [Melia azedarach]|uniref:Uncharacterized protein n=1 Tax=Melia azedarach TaxID=155640 RepID=A0ACC1X5S6_MELAZ|nr:hypothetical protein OWV82_020177 [Melia azedarach]
MALRLILVRSIGFLTTFGLWKGSFLLSFVIVLNTVLGVFPLIPWASKVWQMFISSKVVVSLFGDSLKISSRQMQSLGVAASVFWLVLDAQLWKWFALEFQLSPMTTATTVTAGIYY